MQPPTLELVRTLAELKLADQRDLDRCSRFVRRLAHGLPTLDSIWLDALVRTGCLTPFQAKKIGEGDGHELRVDDDIVLSTPLWNDPQLKLYTGYSTSSPMKSRSQVLVSQFQRTKLVAESAQSIMERLQHYLTRAEPLRQDMFVPHGLAISTTMERDESGPASVPSTQLTKSNARRIQDLPVISVYSGFCGGESLDRLLVRRGRFEERIVWKVAGELTRLLQRAERAQVMHGDLRLTNVRLTSAGKIHLVQWGIVAAIVPEIQLHTETPSLWLTGIAPERIGTGAPVAPASEIYALGCLLWQMLAGRPPFLMADPLEQLDAHRRKSMPDVRSIAPYTSEKFAQLLRNMTAREPHRRPKSFDELAETLHVSQRNSAPLRQLAQEFRAAVPPKMSPATTSVARQIAQSAALLACSLLLTFLFWNRESLGIPSLTLLRATTEAKQAAAEAEFHPLEVTVNGTENSRPANDLMTNNTVTDSAIHRDNANRTAALVPDGQGVLTLPPGEYAAERFEHLRLSELHGDANSPAVIVVRDRPLMLQGSRVLLENLIILDERTNQTVSAVNVQSPQLGIHRCHFSCRRQPSPQPAFVTWGASLPSIHADETPDGQPHSSETAGGQLMVLNLLHTGDSTTFAVQHSLSTARCENVLKYGLGSLAELYEGAAAGWQVPFMLQNCTLRDTGSLVTVHRVESRAWGKLSLRATNCVVSPDANSPVVELLGDVPAEWQQFFEIIAESLVVPSGTPLFAVKTSGSAQHLLSDEGVTIEGLLTGEFHFEPVNNTPQWQDPLVIESLPVRIVEDQLGVPQGVLDFAFGIAESLP